MKCTLGKKVHDKINIKLMEKTWKWKNKDQVQRVTQGHLKPTHMF